MFFQKEKNLRAPNKTLLSFPQKRESNLKWPPAFAGVTSLLGLLNRFLLGFFSAFLILQGCAFNPKQNFSVYQSISPAPYRILSLMPRDSQQRFPLLFVLPGAGMEVESVMESWEDIASSQGWMVLIPEESRKSGNTFDQDEYRLQALLDEVLKNFPVDLSRIFIVGTSAGGTLAEEMVKRNPLKWRGVVLVSFTFKEAWDGSTAFSDLPPLLYLHGEEDSYFAEIRRQAEKLKSKGVSVKLISYPDAGHEHRPEWNNAISVWVKQQMEDERKSIL